jgi:P4 family phage/plasmid primase-like protien
MAGVARVQSHGDGCQVGGTVSRLEAILALARKVPVFPCRRVEQTIQIRGKDALRKAKSPLTDDGFLSATQEEWTIKEWFTEHPDCLWGVPTGRTTGIVVIDYDTEKTDASAQDWVQAHSDALLATRWHSTVSGGRHYLFRSADVYSSGKSVFLDGVKRQGIDIRADGGYIIWWPLEEMRTEGEMIELPAGLLADRSVDLRRELKPLPPVSPESWQREASKAADVLAFHNPEDYDEWIGAGMSLHAASGGSSEGFELWAAWSGGELTGEMPSNYCGVDILRYKWESFSTDRPRDQMRGMGSLVATAKARGYLNGSAKPALPPMPDGWDIVPDEAGRNATELVQGSDIYYGERFFRRSGPELHYTVERGWLVWSGKHWQVDDKAVAVAALAIDSAKSLFDEVKDSLDRKEAFNLAKNACQKRAIEAAIWLTRSAPGVYQQLITFDANPMILNCQNGIVDLKTGMLMPHAKDARCTLLAGATYDQHAQAPRWRQFIGEVCMGKPELMDYLQRVCGYMLTAYTREHCLFFMHGGGRNGKSVMVEALMKVMGDYAGAAEPEMLMTRKHQSIPVDVAALRGRRAVFLNETNQGQRFDEAKLKNLTGGDRLQARFMRENLFEFDPTHKLVLRGNHKPTVNGTDEGIWSRLKLVPFDLRLEPHELDRSLPDKLAAELSGILTWAVEGCLMWQRDGLKTPAVIEDAVKAYRLESDTLGRFLEECCETGSGFYQAKAASLYQRYKEFCELGSERWLSSKDFPYEMEQRGYRKEKKNDGARFFNVRLKIISEDNYRSVRGDD